MQVFARGAGPQVRQQVQRSLANFFLIDIAAQGRVQLVPLHDVAEIADPRCRQGLDRPGGNCIDPDAVLAQILGHVLYRRLQCCLGNSHHIVMRHDLFRAVIGQRQKAAAFGHHRRSPATHAGKRINRDIHRHGKIGLGGVHIPAPQLCLVGKADRMDQKVDLAPFLGNPGEQSVNRRLVSHITLDHFRHADRGDQRIHPLFQRLALIGKRHFGPMFGQRLGNAPGNRFVVREPHDEPALAGHKSS